MNESARAYVCVCVCVEVPRGAENDLSPSPSSYYLSIVRTSMIYNVYSLEFLTRFCFIFIFYVIVRPATQQSRRARRKTAAVMHRRRETSCMKNENHDETWSAGVI